MKSALVLLQKPAIDRHLQGSWRFQQGNKPPNPILI
jgi:hypothetical protein